MFAMNYATSNWRAVGGLTSIYCLRMLGLFLIFPLLTPYVAEWQVSGIMLGLAFGIFALTQSLLQIPFGILSDKFGRKRMLYGGLLLFAIGSLLCAFANNIVWFIVGRAVQGMGAIAGVILAFTVDVTSDKQRTTAMAIIGMAIGAMFFVAMILGPWLHQFMTVPNIFIVVAFMSVAAMVLLALVVPEQDSKRKNYTAINFSRATWQQLWRTPLLLRFTLAMALLTACLSAVFVGLPIWIDETFGQTIILWQIYGLALIISLPAALLLLGRIENKLHQETVHIQHSLLLMASLVFATVLIATSLVLLLWWQGTAMRLIIGLAVFFGGYSLLSGLLPSTVARVTSTENRGLILGFYATGQFLGSFFGAVIAGIIFEIFAFYGVVWFCLTLIPLMILAFVISGSAYRKP